MPLYQKDGKNCGDANESGKGETTIDSFLETSSECVLNEAGKLETALYESIPTLSESIPTSPTNGKAKVMSFGYQRSKTVEAGFRRHKYVSDVKDCAFLMAKEKQNAIDKFQATANSGDVLLFKSKGLPFKFQRMLTGSEYDHVGIILKLRPQEADKIRTIAKDTATGYSASGLYVMEALSTTGVQVQPWESFLTKGWADHYYDAIALRQLQGRRNTAFQETLWTFAKESVGSQYDLSFQRLAAHAILGHRAQEDSIQLVQLYTAADINIVSFIPSSETKAPERKFFCSELAAEALKKVGVLTDDTNPAGFWPLCFSSQTSDLLPLSKGYTFDENHLPVFKRAE